MSRTIEIPNKVAPPRHLHYTDAICRRKPRMPAAIDMTGERYGRLVALYKADPKAGRTCWVFRCDCGVEKAIDAAHVRYGRIKSCGCLASELASEHARAHLGKFAGHNKTHGRSKDPVYFVWKAMHQRCNNPNRADYKYYGARGVRVCERWSSFTNFIQDMGERPDNLTIERIDTDGDYEPSNCKWATWKEQQNNRRNTDG